MRPAGAGRKHREVVDLLFRFVRQNGGALSRRARAREFSKLTPQEIDRIEAIYADVFCA